MGAVSVCVRMSSWRMAVKFGEGVSAVAFPRPHLLSTALPRKRTSVLDRGVESFSERRHCPLGGALALWGRVNTAWSSQRGQGRWPAGRPEGAEGAKTGCHQCLEGVEGKPLRVPT